MTRTLPPIILLEPLSLLGRELLQVMEERDLVPDRVRFFHLGESEEHQVAELRGAAELVPPFSGEELPSGDAVLVIAGTPSPGRREALERVLADDDSIAVLDMAGTGLIDGPVLAGPPATKLWPPRVTVASPGAATVYGLAAPLLDEGLEGVWAAVEVPASARGREGVEAMARRATARLQGIPPAGEDGPAEAFDLAPAEDGRSAAEIAALLPDVASSTAEVLVGVFHGWTVHVGLRFSNPVTAGRILARWDAAGTITRDGAALRLSAVVESDTIHTGPLALSADGRQLAVTACADGLRVGGATTALEILPALV